MIPSKINFKWNDNLVTVLDKCIIELFKNSFDHFFTKNSLKDSIRTLSHVFIEPGF